MGGFVWGFCVGFFGGAALQRLAEKLDVADLDFGHGDVAQ